jgi:pimeloyl-ACP methyl ester carboxylesterase
MAVEPFQIAVEQGILDDLDARLGAARFPDQILESGWDYGTDTGYLRELLSYWRSSFDWREQEARLNLLPQYRCRIDDIALHFAHVPGVGKNPMPLLMLHGWPSTFALFEKIIPLLTVPAGHNAPDAPAFTVIAVSLPGFGFSDRPTVRGMSPARIATLVHTLMTEKLGYARFAIRSGDLGAGVAAQLVLQHPESVIGSHTGGTNPWIQQVPDNLSPEEQAFVENAQAWQYQEMGYAMLQSSKPQTIGHALNDSPLGLAAWIVEKYRRWGDTDGHVESRFSRDELLTNLTIYWATQTITSSMRLYFEAARDPGSWGHAPGVPVAMLMSSKDMFPTPRTWAERSGNFARWTEIDRGGHFLDQEEPQIVADDLRAFFAGRV